MMDKTVDIIIPVWNNLKYTEMCISSIRNNTDTPYQLIIIDNGSTDGIAEYLEKLQKEMDNLKVITNKENLGWCQALNQGIEAGNSEYVLFLNNDTITTHDWLKKMLNKFSDNIAAVGPTSNAVSGRQHIQHNKPGVITEPAKFLIGFCLLIKGEVLDILYKLDGYYIDERFGIGGCEELDLAIRIQNAGYSMLIARDVYIHHFYSKTLGKITDNLQAFHAEKYKVLEKKWGANIIKSCLDSSPKIKILIGMPCIGDIPPKTFLSIIHTRIPFQVAWEVPRRTFPDRARNNIADLALAHGFEYVWYIDSDMAWEDSELLIKLVNHNVDVVGVQAHTRLAPYFPCVFKRAGVLYETIDVYGQGLVEVDAIGASCMLVKTEVFRKVPRPFEFIPVRLMGLDKDMIGEDVGFCRRIKEAGFKVYVDSDLDIWHIGENMLVNRQTWVEYNKVQEKNPEDYIMKIKFANDSEFLRN